MPSARDAREAKLCRMLAKLARMDADKAKTPEARDALSKTALGYDEIADKLDPPPRDG